MTETVEVDGRRYPVTRTADGEYTSTDGTNEFTANSMEALRQAMAGIAGNPRATGNKITHNINRPDG
jgi:hypothetical protein